jgi:hypothetical protein
MNLLQKNWLLLTNLRFLRLKKQKAFYGFLFFNLTCFGQISNYVTNGGFEKEKS